MVQTERQRWFLTFEHQFAKVEINVKPDGTSVVGAEGETVEIQSVILTGVARNLKGLYVMATEIFRSTFFDSSIFSDTTHYAGVL